MGEEKRIKKILKAIRERVQEEVKMLLGTDFTISGFETALLSKEDIFDEFAGKQICARMDILAEEKKARGCLLIGIRDAIRLGGTLIMLPDSELEEFVGREDYSEEIEDSYGEIANIIAGSFTKDFEEMHPKAYRFVRKEQEILLPVKVETESDDPVPDAVYYQVVLTMTLEGNELGSLVMLMPGDFFGLGTAGAEAPKAEPVVDESVEARVGREQPEIDGVFTPEAEVPVIEDSASPDSEKPQKIDVKKHRARIDKLFAICREKMEGEVTALLGIDVKLSGMENRVISKEEFLEEQVSGKQVFANMEVAGDLEGMSYFSVDIKDAIRIGGLLIMLPSSELENAVANDDFSDDTRDAYSEIANVVAGVYTGIFEEQYSKKLRFIRREVCDVFPFKVDIDSDDPMPSQKYYLNSLKLEINGNACSRVNFLVPLDIFDLQGLDSPVDSHDDDAGDDYDAGFSSSADALSGDAPDILLIGDDELEAGKIKTSLERREYSVKFLSFKDNIQNYLSGDLKAVYLVMRDVNELAFGTAIKVSSSYSLPIVAAGPGWTRSMVIRAVKYGVSDILLTPASEEAIEVNVNNNVLRKAA